MTINRRAVIKAGVAAPAIIKLWPALIREAKATLTPGGIVPQSVYQEVSALPNVNGPGGASTTQMPDLFAMATASGGWNDGTTRISTKAQWWQRRSQLKEMFQFYWGGRVPPASPVTLIQQMPDVRISTSGQPDMIQRTFYLKTGPGGALPFWLNLYLPTSTSSPYGSGPFPIILTTEGAWSPLLLGPTTSYSAAPGQAWMAQYINAYGYILAEYSRDNFSWDEGDLSNDDQMFTTAPPLLGPNNASSNPSGISGASQSLFQIYPLDRKSGPASPISGLTAGTITPPGSGTGGWTGYDWGHASAWRWGASRCIDFLWTLSYVDNSKIALTGISRGSDAATVVSTVMDERITVALPHQHINYMSARYQENDGPAGWYNVYNESIGVQDGPVENNGQLHPSYTPRLASFWQPNSVTKSCNVYGGRGKCAAIIPNMGKIPLDTHSLVALLAPRYQLHTNSTVWNEAACCGCAQTQMAGQQIYSALGLSNRLWTRFTDINTYNGGHEMWGPHWLCMLQFCEYVYHGTALPANNNTAGSTSIWCNASVPSSFPSAAPIYSGLGADGHTGWNWSTPTLT